MRRVCRIITIYVYIVRGEIIQKSRYIIYAHNAFQRAKYERVDFIPFCINVTCIAIYSRDQFPFRINVESCNLSFLNRNYLSAPLLHLCLSLLPYYRQSCLRCCPKYLCLRYGYMRHSFALRHCFCCPAPNLFRLCL